MLHHLAFKRTHLAEAYCDSLAGKGIANATSGLFLAGPRRVGKSTFLLEDLIPVAQARNWLPIYIDLWANKHADPGLLITEAVKRQVALYKNKLTKLSERIHLQKMTFFNAVALDFTAPGLPDTITLPDLLIELAKLTQQPILFIIDEAQHTLTSSHGLNAMFSLKSARDQMNTFHAAPHLMLVLTGSNRDKLAQLVVKKDQPFFGSEITPFPLLGHDYTDFFTLQVNQALANNNQFTPESMWEAFQLMGHRPELLRQVVGRTALNHEAQSFSELLKKGATLWHNQIWEEFHHDFTALPRLHQAILTLLIKEGRAWSPFSEESMRYYQTATQHPTLSISSVQTAIQALRERGFIWQSSRGVYALEDNSFAEWFKHTQLTLPAIL